jgi:hypothetical protein
MYHVDILLFVTDHPLRDWGGNGLMQTGRADLATGSAMLNVVCDDVSMADPEGIKCVALHETFHLLGYRHSTSGTDVMNYGDQPTPRLSRFCELQLPMRLFSYTLGFGSSLTFSSIVNGAFFSVVLLPWYMAIELLIFYAYWRRSGTRRISCAIMWTNIFLAFFILAAMSGVIYTLLLPPVFILFTHQVDHTYYAFAGKTSSRLRTMTAYFKVFKNR